MGKWVQRILCWTIAAWLIVGLGVWFLALILVFAPVLILGAGRHHPIR